MMHSNLGPPHLFRRLFALLAFLCASPAPAQVLFVVDTSVDASSTLLTPRDLIADAGSGPLFVQAVDELPSSVAINAFHDAGDEILFVPDTAVVLPGGLLAERRDVVRTDGTSWTLAFDGSAVGVPNTVGIDAVTLDAIARPLVSFDSAVEIGGGVWEDADVVLPTGGFFFPVFDASSEGVPMGLGLDAAHFVVASNTLWLSFTAAGQVAGIPFADEDVLSFDRGTSSWSPLYDASVRDPAIRSADLVAVPEPVAGHALTLGSALLSLLSSARRRTLDSDALTTSTHERGKG